MNATGLTRLGKMHVFEVAVSGGRKVKKFGHKDEGVAMRWYLALLDACGICVGAENLDASSMARKDRISIDAALKLAASIHG